MKRLTILSLLCAPLLAQSSGPAILSRGDAPSAMVGPKIDFQPSVRFTGTYNTSLTGVGLDTEGRLPRRAAYGASLGWGVNGTHRWRRTSLGLNYNGALSHYFSARSFDALTQTIGFGLTRQLSARAALTLQASAGMFNRMTGLERLSQTVPFDPATQYIPTTEFFDNQTIYSSTQAGLTLQRSARLSFSLSGGFFMARYRAAGLHGSRGVSAAGDMQYRLTRRSTVGATYRFSRFSFAQILGETYVHGLAATYGYQIARTVEVSGFAGLMRSESQFIQSRPVDPAIAAIIGISSARQVVHNTSTRPYWSARLSKAFAHGVLYTSAGQAVAPGNGMFLTSYTTSVIAGYGYTGLRRWSLNLSTAYTQSKSVGHIAGSYETLSGGASLSRQILPSTHFVASYSLRKYSSATFANYSRSSQSAAIGIGFSPGTTPLRLW